MAGMKNLDTLDNGLPFLKMHGLGNDFVILDARKTEVPMTAAMARAIGHRYFGVGFDQLVVLNDSDAADVDITFWNTDGSTAGACGNATRCVARIIFDETGKSELTLHTERGLLSAVESGDGLISVNMGLPQLDWQDVPLAREVDLVELPIDGAPGAAGMGNPHCVFVVDDVESLDLAKLGPVYEHHDLFPERTNVEFLQIIDRNTIRMRVWERGGMITYACGSGACASTVVAHRKGLTERNVTIKLDGGDLQIDWREDGVWMTGPTQLVFSGVLSTDFLDKIE